MDYEPVIALVGEVLRRKDPFNHHGQNVSDLSVSVGKLLVPALTEFELEMLRVAGHLHDIGKMLLEDSLLNLPARFTAGQYEVVKTHTTRGWQLVTALKYDPIICDVVMYHHENLDGSGYPRGLKGDEIPLCARIVRVVDTYDSITNHRAYRRADTKEAALMLLDAEAGRIFDVQIVALLKTVLKEQAKEIIKDKNNL